MSNGSSGTLPSSDRASTISPIETDTAAIKAKGSGFTPNESGVSSSVNGSAPNGIAADSSSSGNAFGSSSSGFGNAFGSSSSGFGNAFGSSSSGFGNAFGSSSSGFGNAFGSSSSGFGNACGSGWTGNVGNSYIGGKISSTVADKWMWGRTPRLFAVLRKCQCFMPDDSANLRLLLEIEAYLFVAAHLHMENPITKCLLERKKKEIVSKEYLQHISAIIPIVWCNESLEFHYAIIKACVKAIDDAIMSD